MSKDILNDYFSKSERLDKEPREGFKEELLRSLNQRIVRLEQRKRILSILSALSLIACCCVLVAYFIPFEALSIPSIDSITLPSFEISPIYVVLAFLSFSIIFIASYLINLMEIRELRRQLLLDDN